MCPKREFVRSDSKMENCVNKRNKNKSYSIPASMTSSCDRPCYLSPYPQYKRIYGGPGVLMGPRKCILHMEWPGNFLFRLLVALVSYRSEHQWLFSISGVTRLSGASWGEQNSPESLQSWHTREKLGILWQFGRTKVLTYGFLPFVDTSSLETPALHWRW